jgi:hypothetical protein
MQRIGLGMLVLLLIPTTLLAATVTVSGDGHARIPFELLGGHVWVQGKLNDAESVWVAIDTGASSSVMDVSVAKRMGLKEHGSHQALGAGGSQPGATVSNITLRVGGLTASFKNFDTIDFGPLNSQGRHPFDVVFGSELFEACVARFDYPAGMIDVWENGKDLQAPSETQMPLTFIQHHPYVDAVLKLPGRDPVRGRFAIDTGSNAGVIFSPNDGTRDKVAQSFPRTLEVVARGVGGEVHNRIGRGESFSLGDLTFNRPVVMIPDSTSGGFNAKGTSGNIGGQILARCKITFDYAHHRVGFERAEGFDRPFETDMSGLALVRDDGGLTVRVVNPATPAFEAGMKPGDVITRLDGKPATELDAGKLRSLMQEEGRNLEIEFKRGSTTQTATLRLRRLI